MLSWDLTCLIPPHTLIYYDLGLCSGIICCISPSVRSFVKLVYSKVGILWWWPLDMEYYNSGIQFTYIVEVG
jgi:hypothetical protein